MKSSLMILIIVLSAALALNGYCIQASSKTSVSTQRPMENTMKPVTPRFTPAPVKPQKNLPFADCDSDVFYVAMPAEGYEDVNDWCTNEIGENRGDKVIRGTYVCAGGKPIGVDSCPAGSRLVSTPYRNVSMGYECIKETYFDEGELRCSPGFVLNDWNKYTAVSTTHGNHPNETTTLADDDWFYSCNIPFETLRAIQDRAGDGTICKAPAVSVGIRNGVCCGFLE